MLRCFHNRYQLRTKRDEFLRFGQQLRGRGGSAGNGRLPCPHRQYFPSCPETQMRIGIHMNYSTADEVAEQCQTAGVREIFLSTASVRRFEELGPATADQFRSVQDELQARDVQVSGVILPKPSQDNLLGKAEAERAALCETIRAAGQSGIDTALFYPLDDLLYFTEFHEGRPLQIMPGEDGWEAILDFFREVVAIADEVNLRLASHLWAVEVVKGIWDAVPSPNNGVTYCQGMCLIGEDPHTPAATWGMDKIFFAHARNQKRTGPCLMDHDEVPLETGDVDMARCVRALVEANYDGVIIPEHLGPQSMAAAVTYLRTLVN